MSNAEDFAPIEVCGTITAEDIVAAQELSGRGGGVFLAVAILIGLLALLIFAQVLADGGRPWSQIVLIPAPGAEDREVTPQMSLELTLGLVGAAIVSLAFAFRSWRTRRQPYRGPGIPIDCTVDLQGIRQRNSPASGIVAWESFRRYQATEALCLLHTRFSPRVVLLFPRRLFSSDDQWERFLALVERRVPG
jgi:hypothetical protein